MAEKKFKKWLCLKKKEIEFGPVFLTFLICQVVLDKLYGELQTYMQKKFIVMRLFVSEQRQSSKFEKYNFENNAFKV